MAKKKYPTDRNPQDMPKSGKRTLDYYYLWHLAALNIIDADFGATAGPPDELWKPCVPPGARPEIRGTVWDRIHDAVGCDTAPARVALIDVGASRKHPNLKDRILADDSIDLTTGGALSALGSDAGGPKDRRILDREVDPSITGRMNLSPVDQALFRSVVAQLADPVETLTGLSQGDETFGSHGTAVAGLIVGAPAANATSEDPQRPSLPYYGVDPFSRLISIRTSFEGDPLQFIAAFLYALEKDADVIVLPRGLPDPERGRLQAKEDLKTDCELWENRHAADLLARLKETAKPDAPTPYAPVAGHTDQRLWHILERLVVAISRSIPIVCAAGNDGESQLIFPANLAVEKDNGIIAVGAVTAEGFRSGCSNYGKGLTLVAPSDDCEVFNQHQLRIDRNSLAARLHEYQPGGGREYAYCPLELITTDLPGAFGYSEGADFPVLEDPTDRHPSQDGALTFFGGTSGASALVGGVAALVQRTQRAIHPKAPRLSGVKVKEILQYSSDLKATVAPGVRPLTPDDMNCSGEHSRPPKYFFGSGLLNAARAVDMVLKGC